MSVAEIASPSRDIRNRSNRDFSSALPVQKQTQDVDSERRRLEAQLKWEVAAVRIGCWDRLGPEARKIIAAECDELLRQWSSHQRLRERWAAESPRIVGLVSKLSKLGL
ncbi:hypothetical protein [Terrarubrum flagellatum]|uniref:hypothetical protein n=1 Tax=Terrirubrum flagellatum TaxID=2895980 RepID=UPI003144D93D